ncbi:MAG: ABC transporter substrate-binding protein [Gammaproteobacteria bacterium]|nr:ABC transporter substrate-binding protein [Gammaproteobacteria bacterium]MDD9799979.1 ABC transporter substrate-binding protein [Gammaproteobacteria bacterium]
MKTVQTLTAVLLTLTLAVPAPAAERLTVMLDWFVNPDHGPLIVAQEKNFFASHGLQVELIAPADPNNPPKMVAAGQADIAVSYQPQLHIFAAQGLPLVRIGTLVATPLNSLVVLADSGIRTVADLKNKRIGFSVGGFEDALLKGMLRRHGLGLGDVELVQVNFSLSPSLIAGKVDAVIGAFRNFELNQMDIAGHPGRAFYIEEEGVPPYDELIFVAHKEKLGDKNQREILRRFIKAVEQGVQFLINHPEESWRLFHNSGDGLNNELNRRAWRDTIPRFALRPAALDRARYEKFAEFLRGMGVVETVMKIENHAVEL